MSTRIIASLAAVTTSLLMIAGCATGTEEDGTEDSSSENVATKAETDKAETDSVGVFCSCPAGQDMSSDGLCYPKCAAGYTGAGPVCWQTCAAGFTDTGAFCDRAGSIVSANNSSCHWYDKCGLTFDKGCSTCPSGYSNDGCTCRIDPYIYAKNSYGRGAGSAPSNCSTQSPSSPRGRL